MTVGTKSENRSSPWKAVCSGHDAALQAIPEASVSLDANGGIVFERREQDIAEVLYTWDDSTAEYQRFQGCELVERSSL